MKNTSLKSKIGIGLVITGFICPLFGFGGHQMISKIASVFKWEEWTLPPPKNK